MTGYGIVYLLSPGLYCSKRTAHSILQQTVADIALHRTALYHSVLYCTVGVHTVKELQIELS